MIASARDARTSARGKTLVIVIGQLRAASRTFEPFRRHVLDALGADLAVCLTDDDRFDIFNPFYVAARYRWVAPQPEDMADAFEGVARHLGSLQDWRVICDIQGHWIGGIKQSQQPTNTAVQIYLYWFMLNNIDAAGLRDAYDTFIITRSDFLFLCPHPPIELLDPECIWIPNGEDYGGLTPGLSDRHRVIPSQHLTAAADLMTPLIITPDQMRTRMIHKGWNMEQYFALHLDMHGLFDRVRRFPYIMFLVRTDHDTSSWSPGCYESSVDAYVKYSGEYFTSRHFERLIKDASDWRLFFALDQWIGRSPQGWHRVMNEAFEEGEVRARKTRAIDLFGELWSRAKPFWSYSDGLGRLHEDEGSRQLVSALRHVGEGVASVSEAAPIPAAPTVSPPAQPATAADPAPLEQSRGSRMTAVPLAAITMVYNEPNYLPIWLGYYSRQVGAENCFIVDHGSDDGSTSGLGAVNVLRLPRSPMDDPKRTRFISSLTNGLLEYYDTVIYSDVDELVIAHPGRFDGLLDFAVKNAVPTLWAAGFEVQHLPDEEPPIDLARPILQQRQWARFWGGECKCVLTRTPISWEPGFHRSNAEVAFGDLTLFHLRYFDRDLGLKRLAKTRVQAWPDQDSNLHQRWDDDFWLTKFNDFVGFSKNLDGSLDVDRDPLKGAIEYLADSTVEVNGHVHRMNTFFSIPELWPIDEIFKAAF